MSKKLSIILSVFLISACLFILFCSGLPAIAVQKEEDRKNILNKVSSLQIPFIENQGQIKDAHVKYYAKTLGGTIFITKDGEMVYSLPLFVNPPQWNSKKRTPQGRQSEIHPSGVAKKTIHRAVNPKCEGWVIKESFVGASISQVKGEGKAITKVSYFKGKDTSKWRRNIPTYNLVNLGEIYGGIELKLKAYGNNVEKLFYVKAGANSELIKVKFEGSKTLKVNEKGELEVETGLGVVKFTKPVAYQEENGKRKHIEVAYAIKGYEYFFEVGDYDRTKELVIDPLLASTLLGGGNLDDVNSMTIDSSGNVYVVGVTQSSNFPTTPGAYDTGYNGFQAVFISKLDTNLQNLLASTFLGGTGSDDNHDANSISLDISGNVYVTGWTNSSSFPTTHGAYDRTFNGYGQGFVSKIDSNLQNLLASTFLGGGNNIDIPRSITIDGVGTVYVTGHANSSDFPTTSGAYQTTHSGGFHSADVFVSRLDASLQNLLASTFLGSTNNDYPSIICLDNGGNVYAAGHTASSDFPTTFGAYDTGHNGGGYYGADAFVSKLDGNLQNLLASTFLGSAGDDFAESISIIGGNVYVAGNAGASDFPTTPGAYDRTYNGSGDAFVSKLDGDFQNLLASTFLGSSGQDHCCSVTTDSIGNIYIAGFTTSPNFPSTSAAYDTTFNGFSDGFVSKLDSDLSALLPDISIVPTSHNFGAVDVASTSKQTFTVSNTGNGELVVGTLSITGTDESEFDLQNDNCSQRTIAPSGHCTVDVVFSPVLKGPKTANLSVPSDDLDTPTLDVPLSGIGSGEAKIIYVNDDATCPGDGTQDSPFCNLRDGVNVADHDDTVYVMAGTYEIDVLPAHSWDANPIVMERDIILRGEDPNTTIIKSLPYGEFNDVWDIRLLEIRANVVVEGFTFDIPNPVQDYEKHIFVEDVTGIQAYTNTGNITIQNNIFKVGRYSSDSEEWGYVRAIYINCANTGSGTIKNNQFLGEYQQGSYVTPIGFRFYYSHDSSINITNNIFCKFRWGMLMNGPETGSANTVIINNTLDQNDVAIHLWWRGNNCNLGTVRNNIMTNNHFGVQVSAGEEINLSDYLYYDHNNYFENEYNIALKLGTSGPYVNTALGTGSIEADPLYVGNGNYHLTVSSPCIDAGSSEETPEDDIEGNARPQGKGYDIGAYEFPIDPSLTFLFPFEDDGGTTTDISGNDNDGTVSGALFLPGGGILNSNAYQFDWSSHNNIQVPYQESQTATEALTSEAWVYPTAWDNIYFGYNRIVSKYPVYLLRGANNGHPHFQILTESHGYQGVYDSQVMSLNEWHYVVGTFDGLSLKLYVDGILRDFLELAEEDTISTNERDIFVGESPVLAEGFTGTIDNVAIYKRARSQSEIEETYASIMRRGGDFDGDKDIDGYDLAVFADAYAVEDSQADLNGDGYVDSEDLALFAASFGRTGL